MNPLLQKARQLRIAAGLPPLLKGKAHKTAPHNKPNAPGKSERTQVDRDICDTLPHLRPIGLAQLRG